MHDLDGGRRDDYDRSELADLDYEGGLVPRSDVGR
jgi:hypothetical protein